MESNNAVACPNELLRLIFSFCCEPLELRGFGRQTKPVSSIYDTMMALDALSLSHVCYRWRQTALSTPKMWTDISVCLEDGVNYTQKELDNCYDIVRLYLKRSGGLPSSVRLRLPIGIELRGSDEFEWHRAITRTLLEQSKRWHQVYLGMCRFNVNYLAWNPGGATFPELRIAAIECFYDDQYLGPEDQDVDEILSFPLDVAPELHTLFLKDTPFSLSSTIPDLPLLSHLEIQGHFSNPLPALEWATAGCDIVIREVPDELENMDSIQEWDTIECDATSLTFEISSNSRFSPTLFERVTYSPVDTLRFVASNESGGMCAFPLEHFQTSILDLVPETLELVHLQITETDLVQIISGVSHLKSLLVYEKEHQLHRPSVPLLTADTFKQLLASRHPDPLLPDLQSLTLSFRFTFEEEALLSMIESRCSSQTVSPLRSVTLHLTEHMKVSEHFRERIGALEWEGVSVSVRFD